VTPLRSEIGTMTLRIASTDFDQVDYDADADVLYIAARDPARAVEFDETPEGHALRFDADGSLVGITSSTHVR
jgi:uncharacterized protein YuzE